MGLFETFKQLIVNDPADIDGNVFSLSSGNEEVGKSIKDATFDGWTGSAYANTTDSASAVLQILGFGKIKKAGLKKFRIGRAIAGQVQKTKIKVAGSGLVSGSTAMVRIVMKSDNLESEFEIYHPEYKKEKRYQITFDTTLDNVEFYKDLAALILKDISIGGTPYFDVLLVDATNTVNNSAPTGILISSKTSTISFDIYLTLPVGLTTTFITDIAANDTDGTAGGGSGADIVQIPYNGRNTYEQLRKMALQVDGNVYPYSEKLRYLPQAGAKYVSFYVEIITTNEEVGQSIVGQSPITTVQPLFIFLKEGTCNLVINNLARFLDMSIITDGYFYTGSTYANVAANIQNTNAGTIQMTSGVII